jgi:uncharacterized repeat protein (TIGR03803 family)
MLCVTGAGCRTVDLTEANGVSRALAQTRLDRTPAFTSLYSFKGGLDGQYPITSLLEFHGFLYGTTGYGGYTSTVFRLSKDGRETVLHDFTNSGQGYAAFSGLTNVRGEFFGSTDLGGSGNQGVIFAIAPTGEGFRVAYDFQGSPDGRGPTGNLLLGADGRLYGTTVAGGTLHDYGTVFSFDPLQPLGDRALHAFRGGSDGSTPYTEGVVMLNGALYGATWQGSTVYKVTLDGKETVIHHFRGDDGAEPLGTLIAYMGDLYGTAGYGGANGDGTVFRTTTDGKFAVLHAFTGGSDGMNPEAGLLAANGVFYGTTTKGGAHDAGTVFSITPTGDEKVLYSFSGPDGALPSASLIDVDGTLYGTAEVGGTYNYGTVFALKL